MKQKFGNMNVDPNMVQKSTSNNTFNQDQHSYIFQTNIHIFEMDKMLH